MSGIQKFLLDKLYKTINKNNVCKITEIPYIGAFLLTDTTVEADGHHQAAEEDAVGHEKTALQQADRPVAEDSYRPTSVPAERFRTGHRGCCGKHGYRGWYGHYAGAQELHAGPGGRVEVVRWSGRPVLAALSEQLYIMLPQPVYMQKRPAVAVDIVR